MPRRRKPKKFLNLVALVKKRQAQLRRSLILSALEAHRSATNSSRSRSPNSSRGNPSEIDTHFHSQRSIGRSDVQATESPNIQCSNLNNDEMNAQMGNFLEFLDENAERIRASIRNEEPDPDFVPPPNPNIDETSENENDLGATGSHVPILISYQSLPIILLENDGNGNYSTCHQLCTNNFILNASKDKEGTLQVNVTAPVGWNLRDHEITYIGADLVMPDSEENENNENEVNEEENGQNIGYSLEAQDSQNEVNEEENGENRNSDEVPDNQNEVNEEENGENDLNPLVEFPDDPELL